MPFVTGVFGCMLLVLVLWDAFEVVILPRRVAHRFRCARAFYRFSWRLWSTVAHGVRDGKRRETYLSIFGPLSLLMLLSWWAAGIIAAFTMIH